MLKNGCYAFLLFNHINLRKRTETVNGCIDRAYRINNTAFGFNQDVVILTEILNKNLFPSHFIKRFKENYLTKVKGT